MFGALRKFGQQKIFFWSKEVIFHTLNKTSLYIQTVGYVTQEGSFFFLEEHARKILIYKTVAIKNQ